MRLKSDIWSYLNIIFVLNNPKAFKIVAFGHNIHFKLEPNLLLIN